MNTMGKLLDPAAEARANRSKKLAAKKLARSILARQQVAVAAPASTSSRGTHSRSVNARALNAQTQDTDFAVEGLRYILKKELRNSDVNHLGRVVLPKRESEDYLPCLIAKEGIPIVMNDYTSTQAAWIFKYRFWPNNRSRMYVLENIGNYIKHHRLTTGDFIAIYKDDSNDRYVIRAKKLSAISEEEKEEPAAPAVPETGHGQFFDFNAAPEFPVDTARPSDPLLQPSSSSSSDGLLSMEYGYGRTYDFMQAFSPAPFLQGDNNGTTNTGSSSSYMEPLSPLFPWN